MSSAEDTQSREDYANWRSRNLDPLLEASGGSDGLTLLSVSEFVHRYTCQQIALADSKASAVLAGASFAFALGLRAYSSGVGANPFSIASLIALAALILLIFAALTAFLVILPRLSEPRRDIVYFRDVAARPDAASYFAELLKYSQQPETVAKLLSENAYVLAGLCDRKFELVHRALILLGFGVVMLCLRIVM